MRHRAFLWLILLCLLAVAPAPAEEQFLKPDEAFRISARHEAGNLLITWKIAEGYYLYRSKFRFHAEPEGVEFGVARYPETLTKHDEFFGDVEVYRDEFTVELPIRATGGADILTLEATSQGCADAGLCFPPHRQKLLVAVPASTPVDEIEAPAELPPKAADDAVSAVLGTGTAAAPQSSPASPGTATRDLQTFADDLGLGDLDDDILPAEEAFRFSADTLDPDSLRLQWHIAEGTYLYSDKLKIELMGEGVALGEFQLPKPKIKHDTVTPDGEIGDVSVYVGDIDLTVPLLRSRADPTEVELIARYQGCADRGICYPPQTARVSLSLPATTQIAAIIPVDSGPDAGDRPGQDAAAATAATEPVAEQDQIAGLLEGSGTWVILGTFFLIGLGLAFTPCVFPMIPILSGIITGQGSSITAGKAFSLSLVYVLAMAVTYTAAGVIAALSGENLQAALQNPVALTIFAAVFVALALSMFGFYDLQLPSSWQSRLSEISNRQHGGTLAGAGVMGFLSALIVGPCVAPPLAGALIYIGQSGDAILGGSALFAMSLGMGMPLLAIGTSAGKLLPRAGAWMDSVKAVFGVVMLGVAIYLVERILPESVIMLLWGGLLIVSAIYMGALTALPADSSGWRKLWKGLGSVLLVYGALMLVGAASGGKDTLQPLRGLMLAGGSGPQTGHFSFRPIKTVADLEREVAAASADGRAVMLDFYADWCVYCKQMERDTFPDPDVNLALENVLTLQADVTANDDRDKELLAHFNIPAPPALLFFDAGGRERRNYRLLGYKGPEEFASHVRNALQ